MQGRTSVTCRRAWPRSWGGAGAARPLEPHPQLFHELEANCRLAAATHAGVRFELRNAALSEHDAPLMLQVFDETDGNRGVSTIAGGHVSSRAIAVTACRLDDVLDDVPRVGLMKVDVEGHERPLLE